MKTSTSKKEAPQCNKAKGGATDKPHCASTVQAVKWLALLYCTGASYGKISTKAKAPARRNAFDTAVSTPTDKRGFFTPKFFRHGFAHIGMVYGRGVNYPQGRSRGCIRVSNHHAHPLRVETQPVVLKSHTGAPTMQQVNALGQTAPTPTTGNPTTSASQVQAFALLEATSNANLAAFYIRKGNLAAARRKAVQLLKSLQALPAKD